VERQRRAQTLSHIVRVVATTVLLVVATMLILSELGVNLAPILATAGIGGLAIGFGAQNLVRDVITGFVILLEGQIRAGDVVKVGDKGGLAEGIDYGCLPCVISVATSI
jgi:moderate conductance mechanosensitive channel